jgi:ATP synthase F1 complex assembly factor 2
MDIDNKDKKSLKDFERMLTPRPLGETASSNTPRPSATRWYGVTLDGRTLSTPMGQTLALPSQSLAYMVAAEWDAQTKRLQPTNMPFMTLACTVLDQAALHPRHYQDEALKYLPTDTTCFWADPLEDRVLYRRQEQAWSSLHQFIEERLGEKPITAMGMEGILMSRRREGTKPFAGLPHPSPLLDAAKEWTHSLDAWRLIALNSINAQSKSWMVGYAMLMNGPFDDLSDAVQASRVEEEFQICNWGLVEGGHDYDRVNCSIQLHASSLFSRAVTESLES